MFLDLAMSHIESRINILLLHFLIGDTWRFSSFSLHTQTVKDSWQWSRAWLCLATPTQDSGCYREQRSKRSLYLQLSSAQHGSTSQMDLLTFLTLVASWLHGSPLRASQELPKGKKQPPWQLSQLSCCVSFSSLLVSAITSQGQCQRVGLGGPTRLVFW